MVGGFMSDNSGGQSSETGCVETDKPLSARLPSSPEHLVHVASGIGTIIFSLFAPSLLLAR